MKKKHHPFFRPVRGLATLCTPPHTTVWEAAYEGEPAVFAANHDRAYGPLIYCTRFELAKQLRPWVTDKMCFIKEVPRHIRGDFWWRPNRWYSRFLDYTIAYLIAPIVVGIMSGIDAIPVYKDRRITETFKESIAALNEGCSLLIFPERVESFDAYAASISQGFLHLAKKYHRETGKCLSFYPTYASAAKREIRVAPPAIYDPALPFTKQKLAISAYIETSMARMRMEATANH